MRFSEAGLKSQRGSSLLTVIGIATFISLTIAGIVMLTGNRQKELAHDDLRVARDLVYRRVSSQISLVSAIRHSMTKPGNAALSACMSNPATCTAGNKPFHLYYPFSPTISSMVASGTTPVTYSAGGERQVGAASDKIPFEALAFFAVSQRADSNGKMQWLVTTQPQVNIRGGVTFPGGLTLANRPLPSDLRDDAAATKPPYKTKFEMLVKDVMTDATAVCNEYSFLSNAQNAKGTAAKVCTCLPGFTPVPGSNPDRPTCTNPYCLPPKILIGFQENNAPLCADQVEANYTCTEYTVSRNGRASCPVVGGRHDIKMRAAQMAPGNKCRLKSGVAGCPKAKCVECDNMKIKCCRKN